MEKTIKNLRNHKFDSRKLDENEIEKVVLADYQCEDCGESVFDLSDFPETQNIENSNCICENCYDERYLEICDCCEESYEPREDQKKYLIFSKTNGGAVAKIGIYEVLKRPYFISNYFSQRLLDDSIKIVRACDIESMLDKIYGRKHEINSADCICQSCAEKFGLITPMVKNRHNYCNDFVRIHHNIHEKGIIEQGF